MAHIHQIINVENIINKYNIVNFIETGTGMGETLDYVSNCNFKSIQSCEIERDQYNMLKQKYKDDRIRLWCGDSTNMLITMLKNTSGPSLIFLDAHFPGTGYVRDSFIQTSDINTLPLEDELNILKSYKYLNKSVIVVDDLRIYEDREYSGGKWEDRIKVVGELDSNFIYTILSDTHDYSVNLAHQGSVIYTPRGL